MNTIKPLKFYYKPSRDKHIYDLHAIQFGISDTSYGYRMRWIAINVNRWTVTSCENTMEEIRLVCPKPLLNRVIRFEMKCITVKNILLHFI